jgi:hypothetical protein
MIQEALATALQHAVATPVPSDLSWLADAFDGKHAEFGARLRADLARGERELQNFRSNSVQLRERMWAAFATGAVEPHHLEVVELLIGAIEERAASDAIELGHRLKRLRKTTLKVERFDNELKPLMKETNSRLAQLGRAEIEERLDFALFLRALRAAHGSEAGPVASFSNGPDMSQFLKKELGL